MKIGYNGKKPKQLNALNADKTILKHTQCYSFTVYMQYFVNKNSAHYKHAHNIYLSKKIQHLGRLHNNRVHKHNYKKSIKINHQGFSSRVFKDEVNSSYRCLKQKQE